MRPPGLERNSMKYLGSPGPALRPNWGWPRANIHTIDQQKRFHSGWGWGDLFGVPGWPIFLSGLPDSGRTAVSAAEASVVSAAKASVVSAAKTSVVSAAKTVVYAAKTSLVSAAKAVMSAAKTLVVLSAKTSVVSATPWRQFPKLGLPGGAPRRQFPNMGLSREASP